MGRTLNEWTITNQCRLAFKRLQTLRTLSGYIFLSALEEPAKTKTRN